MSVFSAFRINLNRLPLLLAVTLGVVGLDQWSKLWVIRNLGHAEMVTVIPRCFHLVQVHNKGAAFGFLAAWPHGAMLLTAISLLAIGGIVGYYFSAATQSRCARWALAMILGGALGNLIDRLRLGYVVDFIDWHWDQVYHWPAFNIADASISIAVGLLLVDMFQEGRRTAAKARG